MVCEFMCSSMQHCAVGCVALGTGKNCTTTHPMTVSHHRSLASSENSLCEYHIFHRNIAFRQPLTIRV